MPSPRERRPFVPEGAAKAKESPASATQSKRPAAPNSLSSAKRSRSASQGIPDAVANRMARRIAIATGIPSLLGMAVFVASYVLVSRQILAIPPSATLLASGACFLLGLLGLSYGVLSSSWEDAPGSLLGSEQIGLNVGRIRASLKAMRQDSAS